MRLHVRHQTAYSYSRPVSYAIQTLHLTPQPYEGLAVLAWRVSGEARRLLPSFVDGFGNITHCHSVSRSHDRASVLVEGEVETRDTGGLVRGAPEPLPPLFFLRETPLTAPSESIIKLAQEGACGESQLETLTSLMHLIHVRMTYRAGVTDSATTAAKALSAGAGVCQDHAHVFVAAARHLGVPARYVGGYLWTGVDGHEYQASHAWAEAYIEGIGWFGFDPSNNTLPTESYIRTAAGLDYASAAPVRGVWRGEAEETLSVSVRVAQAGQQQ